MLHTNFITALLANTSLTAIIGQDIYPVIATDAIKNCIIYNQVSGTPDYHQEGLSSDQKIYSFMAVADTYDKAISIASKIRSTIELNTFDDTNGTVYQAYYSQFISSEYDATLQCYIITEAYRFNVDY